MHRNIHVRVPIVAKQKMNTSDLHEKPSNKSFYDALKKMKMIIYSLDKPMCNHGRHMIYCMKVSILTCDKICRFFFVS